MTGFWSILLGGITVLAGSGLALGAALGLTGLLLLQFSAGGSTFVAVDAVWNVLNSFTLSAIPLFIILGEIMLRSGISERVYAALSPVFQRVPGGLLHTNIAVCTLFGAVSGSSLSTAAAVGSVAYPEMTRRGYDRKYRRRIARCGWHTRPPDPAEPFASHLWSSDRNLDRPAFPCRESCLGSCLPVCSRSTFCCAHLPLPGQRPGRSIGPASASLSSTSSASGPSCC